MVFFTASIGARLPNRLPVLLLLTDADASLLTNGSAAFKWKLCCHWLIGLRQHLIAVVIHGPVLSANFSGRDIFAFAKVSVALNHIDIWFLQNAALMFNISTVFFTILRNKIKGKSCLVKFSTFPDFIMMTSSNGNIFLVAVLLGREFPSQRPVTQSFDVFFDLCLNKRLSKPSRRWWFDTPSRSLWRHRNVIFQYCGNAGCLISRSYLTRVTAIVDRITLYKIPIFYYSGEINKRCFDISPPLVVS